MDRKSLTISVWLGIFMVFSLILFANVKAQVQDITPPSLVSFSFTPTAIDTSTQDQTVTVTMRVTDDLSGFGNGYTFVGFASPSNQQLVYYGNYFAQRISGNPLDGIYQVSITVPRFSETGTWTVNLVHLTDDAGNGREYYTSDLTAAGFPTKLTIGPFGTLTLSKSGSGTGRVTSSPSGIDCGLGCTEQSAEFGQGTPVTLTEEAGSGSTFQGWTGGGCSGKGPCEITMGADPVTVTAQFVQQVGHSLSGTVTSGGSGVSGVTISLTGSATMSTTTDSGGSYSFSGLSNGAYTITPSKAGYTFSPSSLPATISGADVSGQSFTAATVPGAPTGVTATAGNGQVTVTFMPPASDGGSPIIYYTVTLSFGGIMAPFTGPGSPITVMGLTNGTAYTVTVTATNAVGTGPPSSPPITVTPVAPPVAYSISGTVTSGGSGVSGVKMDLTGAASNSTSTDSNGYYSFSGLSNGAYTITPSMTGYTFTPPSITVDVNGADVTGQSFTAACVSCISGTLTSGGAALSGVTIKLTGAATKSTTTSASGNYSFCDLPNGAYTITPGMTGYTFTPPSLGVSVNCGSATGQNFSATFVGFSISGTLTSGGAALSGVTISLTGAAAKSRTSDASGNYSFSGLANGAYTITPSMTGYTFTPPSISVNVNRANVTGQDFTASPPLLHVFIRGSDDALYDDVWDGSNWSGWLPVAGLTKDSPAAVGYEGQIFLFVRGVDNALWQNIWDGSKWSGWSSLGGYLVSTPAAVSYNRLLQLFVVGWDNALYTKSYDGSKWSDWSGLGGVIYGPPVAVNYNGLPYVFVVGKYDHALYQMYWDGSKWSEWTYVGGYHNFTPGAASINDGGINELHLLAVGWDNALYQCYWDGGKWSDWVSLGGVIVNKPTATDYAGQLDVFVTGQDHAIWQDIYNEKKWSGWTSLGGLTPSAPAVATYTPGG